MIGAFLLLLAGSAEASQPNLNPVQEHSRCVNETAVRLVSSGEPASVLVDVAMTKCASAEGHALDWFMRTWKGDPQIAAIARRNMGTELRRQAREDALVKVVEAKAKKN